ncbi:MAG: serine/threonine-protein kinase [Polyangiaceae bacterium]
MTTPEPTSAKGPRAPRAVGRYLLFDEIASGGMATVHLGRLVGPAGFSRTVAIKRLHPQYAKDPDFVAMFLDEARLAARIRHPNVVSTLDIVQEDDELFLVMDYVQGEALSRLIRSVAIRKEQVPPEIAIAICSQLLLGLHAAHEAKDEHGQPLGIVHRDVSPQNVLVGVDGASHVVDFGVAKAAARVHTTQDGAIKGKIAYMAPEQVRQLGVDRRTDVFSASVVTWETLTGKRLFATDDVAATITRVLAERVIPPSTLVPGLPAAVDTVILRGLSRNPDDRYTTAREMARELQASMTPASAIVVGEWVEKIAAQVLQERAQRVSDVESQSTSASIPHAMVTRSDRASVDRVEGSAKTDLSSAVSLSEGRTQQTRRLLVATALAVVLLLVGGVWLLGRSSGSELVAAGSADVPPMKSSAPVPSAIAQPNLVPAVTSAPPPVPPVASSAAADTPAPAPIRKPAVVAPRPTPKPVAKPAANCNPPYSLNPDGSKRFKPECF